MGPSRRTVAGILLSLAVSAVAHGEEHSEMAGTGMGQHNDTGVMTFEYLYEYDNYYGLSAHSGMMVAHIALMVAAWFFILPIGVVFSIGRSRLALPVQLLFLALNGVGVVLGTAYNVSTPDLYVKNAHHSIGWIATWIMTAQVVMSLLFVYGGWASQETVKSNERAAFLPATFQTEDHANGRPYHAYRWSGDSGHGTEPPSPRNSSQHLSLDQTFAYDPSKAEVESDDEYDEPQMSASNRASFFRSKFLDKYLSAKAPKFLSSKILKTVELAYDVIDRTVLILGFIALTTGGVTYAGIFRGQNVFNGLAHFIKGGIFFWYGLLTLGRWMGCFADLGWAWNIKPTRSEVGQWKASLPSAEFVESFVIWLYGFSNMFLEHLAGWGGRWTAQDYEHVSISIMFFGGGLCGMLVESKTIRRWLNTSVDQMPSRTEVHPTEAQEARTPPRTYTTSMNVLPALIILLLGLMMSSHHQESMTSTMVHKQWGTLLCGFSLARGFTYISMWLSPPTSIYPSRPPTELISAFCLIAGGLVFMASTKDIMWYMDVNNLMAMFLFTVMMGMTAFLMAYEILVLSLKGWAVRRENKNIVSY